MERHDRAANSLLIYLEVVRRFPKTRAAIDALYTAAVCHERLSGYNDYWTSIYSMGRHAGSRMVTYPDVRSAYPDYQLPRGTYGWKPSTRTVNGGPAWVSAPRPKPGPTRKMRLFNTTMRQLREHIKEWGLFTASVAKWVGDAISTFYDWLWTGFALAGLLFLWRRSAEARIEMARQVASCAPYPDRARLDDRQGSPGKLASLFDRMDSGFNWDLRDKWYIWFCIARHYLRQLSAYSAGRHALALNAATHGMLVALMFKLL